MKTRMVRVGKPLRAIALAGVLALVLSGCTSASAPGGSSTTDAARPVPGATEAPAPVPVPVPTVDPLELVTGIVPRPDVVELRDAQGGVIASISYMSSAAEAIATFSTVFGSPPLDEPYDGGNHAPDGIMHTWDGFVLDERFYDEERRVEQQYDYLVWPRFAVYLDAPAAHGIPLSSVQGIQAGDSWEAASGDPGFRPDLYTCVGTPIDTLDMVNPQGDEVTATVVLAESAEGGTVRWVGAPEMVSDGCA